MFGLIAPGIAEAFTSYPKNMLGDSTKARALPIAMRFAFNVDAAYDGWKYLREDLEPVWLGVFGIRQAQLLFCNVPTLAVNLSLLVSGTLEPGAPTYTVYASTASALFGCHLLGALTHSTKGPPSNAEKYRVWDADAAGVGWQFTLMYIYDNTSIWYRLIMCALLYIAEGIMVTFAFLAFSGAFQAILFWETFSQMPLPFKRQLQLTTGQLTEYGIFDANQFEPVAAICVYSRHCYAFRFIQACIAICLISRSHDKLAAYPGQTELWIMAAMSSVSFVLWASLGYFLQFRVFANEFEDMRLKAQAFFSMLAEMKKKKIEAAKTAEPTPGSS